MRINLQAKKIGSMGAMMIIGTSAIVSAGMPSALAESGKEGSNGIVWGDNKAEEGTYKIPTAGGELEGFCVDPGLAYPKQGGATQYGAPYVWGEKGEKPLADADKTKMVVALYLGQQAVYNSGAVSTLTGALANIPGAPDLSGVTANDIAAGASGVVHNTSAKYGMGKGTWNNTLNPNANKAFKAIDQLSSVLGGIAGPALGNVDIMLRAPQDGSNKQRMVALSDIKLPELPGLPSIPNIPTGSTTPTTSESTKPETPSTTPSESTSPTKPSETVTKPVIRTSAGSSSENVVEKGATITDTVSYQGLEAGKSYTLEGELVDKSTGKKTGDKGKIGFTADSEEGTQDVQIKVNKADSDELVVFEKLLDDKGQEVATHEDVNDESQTVGKKERTPEIRTSAQGSTGNKIESGTTITDTVSYSGLEPGKTYRLEARLMCKKDGTDTGASQTQEFKADKESGEAKVENIAVTNPDCNEQVAFEKLYDEEGYLVASHEDITDASQTVGGETEGKKKVAQPSQAPESQPLGMGGGNPQPEQQAPRQVINSVPSGQGTIEGSTIFNR